ncbi:MAG: LytTR family transcriptional regulator [Clostridiales bacterium]|nr:LytTR family transcriptional regulator [Clostridiales bacterium]
MKVKIEIVDDEEEEIVIRCNTINDTIQRIQAYITDITNQSKGIIFYKDDTEYYIPINEIVFFETDNRNVNAHTKNNIFLVKYKLYELEELLPGSFMRVSKSTIVNINHIYSITKNITSSSIIEFYNTHKKVYVSRYYYKPLKCRLDEKRLNI